LVKLDQELGQAQYGDMAKPAKKPCPTGKRASIYEAKTHFSALVERARAGEEIEITKNGQVVARLAPATLGPPKRKLGGAEGKIWISPDFDAPLDEELQAYFDGRVNDFTDEIDGGRDW
jgi:prevent-host-death family protein